jgi:dipeptidyl aminopeptidase/acylaminoacyl peptidase
MSGIALSAVRCLVLAVTTLALAAPGVLAQERRDPEAVLASTEFVSPPSEIADAVLAPRHLNVTLSDVSPDSRWFIDEVGDGPATMDRFSKPFDELGGVFIDHRANRLRSFTIGSGVGIRVVSAADGAVRQIQVPAGTRITSATWSPDGSRLAFFGHTPDATHIYVADPENGRSRRISDRPVLATLVSSFEWTSDGREIATVLVPGDRAPRPVESPVPAGPQVKLSEEGENMLRTYASLMATPYDELLLEWHATGQLAAIDVEGDDVREIGEPGMVEGFDFAPDGRHARVETMRKPFSYIVPVRSFGGVEEIWDRSGNVLVELDVNDLETGVDDDDDEESGDSDRRQLAWREDGAGLTFLQRPAAEDDDGDEEEEEEDDEEEGDRVADQVMLWAPPFDEESVSVVYSSGSRIAGHRFSSDYGMLFLTERSGGDVREYAVELADPDTELTLVEYDADDFYADPGSLLMEGGRVPGGGHVVQTSADGSAVFYYGQTFAEDPMEEGPRSFLDRVEIRTGEKERIYESSNEGQYERIVSVLDVDAGRFVVARETPTEIEQSYLLEAGERTQLTANVDYTPDITNAPRQRFTVERPDGFRFLVSATLPPDYTEGERLPAMFWFYPREYTDQESYDERGRTYNVNAFPDMGTRSMEYLVRLGYAVVEPDAPIVGESGQMNDNYEHDLRNNLAAVIDELDARGIIDRRRLGIGGHSYGAFGTANAMVHTPFFKAGIAGDGNYNRTLTPLSFQSERRLLWEARDVYLGMSPFMYANNLTGALLLYHGLHDQNVGTAPDHSPRLFHALNGLGKTAAMYLYPYEDHGPASRSTLLDLWGRWTAWLDVHLTDPDERPVTQ